jgi:hypothetical protein
MPPALAGIHINSCQDFHLGLRPLHFTPLLGREKLSSLNSNEIADKESEFAHAFNTAQDFLSHRGRLGEFYWLTDRVPAFRRACKTSHSFVDSATQRALKAADEPKQSRVREDKKRYVFIDALIEET